MREISLAAARCHAVRTQRFAARRRKASQDELVACIERLGCVQIDSISVVDRSQRLVLASRCGRLPANTHDALLRSGRVFEYWAHEACLLPSIDEPYFRHDKRASGQFHRWYGPILKEHPKLADEVMALARERGEISARDFGGAGKGYWEWTPAKRVIDALWTAGQLAIAGRNGMERRYALPERVLPDAILGAPEPPLSATRRMQVERAVRARGIASEARVSDYYRVKGKRRTLVPAIEALVAEGVLERLRMRELGDLWLVPAEDAERAIAGDDRPAGAFLLSPFDNLLWDRFEAEHLFGFEHRLEIYKPALTRIYGYYVLPLLDGPEVVGRVDLKADRKAGTLRALAVHWQRRQRPRALREALGRLAQVLGLERSEIQSGV
ncbi:MAG TPA: crosslink repair DNA glycosylase YcaQ family protein [Gaiellales bacterium]|nr:crosslink repair DNA glycosylase YcaQ family protein [Gaiellales bacterium]